MQHIATLYQWLPYMGLHTNRNSYMWCKCSAWVCINVQTRTNSSTDAFMYIGIILYITYASTIKHCTANTLLSLTCSSTVILAIWVMLPTSGTHEALSVQTDLLTLFITVCCSACTISANSNCCKVVYHSLTTHGSHWPVWVQFGLTDSHSKWLNTACDSIG